MHNGKLNLQTRFRNILKTSDEKTLAVLKILCSAVKQWEIDHRTQASDEKILILFNKLALQCQKFTQSIQPVTQNYPLK